MFFLNHITKKLITYAWKVSEIAYFKQQFSRIDLVFKLRKNLEEDDMN